jgi:hypothetical protein
MFLATVSNLAPAHSQRVGVLPAHDTPNWLPSMLRLSIWSAVAWITPDAVLAIQDRGMAPARAVAEVTRRRGQVTRAQLRQWWPHHVVLSADRVKGLRNSTTVHDFANSLSVAPRTYWLRRNDAEFVVFCFTRPEDAETFCERFGGERLSGTQEQSEP